MKVDIGIMHTRLNPPGNIFPGGYKGVFTRARNKSVLKATVPQAQVFLQPVSSPMILGLYSFAAV